MALNSIMLSVIYPERRGAHFLYGWQDLTSVKGLTKQHSPYGSGQNDMTPHNRTYFDIKIKLHKTLTSPVTYKVKKNLGLWTYS